MRLVEESAHDLACRHFLLRALQQALPEPSRNVVKAAAGVKTYALNTAISTAVGTAYSVGSEAAAQYAISQGADPVDVELLKSSMDATISIVSMMNGLVHANRHAVPCFVAGTLVETEKGPRAIERLRIGDRVVSWDGQKLVMGTVTRTFETAGVETYEVALRREDGSEERLETTREHPFWVEGVGWTAVSELRAGDEVATLEGPARVVAVGWTGRRETVFNVEIRGARSYFVGAGGALVHNTCSIRIRHYTNSKGLEGIRQSGVIRAGDKGRVFADRAAGKALSPRDAEARFGLKIGRGRNIVETDVPANRVEIFKNPRTQVEELRIRGDVPLQNETFKKR